jgi:hypothetical protein
MNDAQPKEWWKQLSPAHLGEHYDISPHTWIEKYLIHAALDGGPPSLSTSTDGNILIEPAEFMTRLLEMTKMHPMRIYSSVGDPDSSVHTIGSADAMAQCHFPGKKYVSIQLTTADRELFDRAKAFFKEHVLANDTDCGTVYTLAKKQGDYEVHRMGTAGIPLERGNYSDDVLEAYDYTVSELATDSPAGRLTILSGSPGTGKTYLVRALLRESKETTFVLISPALVRDLGDPEILPCLTSLKAEVSGPLMLVLEDADQCLAPREAGNMSTVQAVLNLGDGILGSLLDMRILATTNAMTHDFDPAVRRPGRLSRHTEVGLLQPLTANRVVERLLEEPAAHEFRNPVSLAEAYSAARKRGWKPKPRTDKLGNKIPT